MSTMNGHDFDSPPRLSTHHSRAGGLERDRLHTPQYHASPFSTSDRHSSMGFSSGHTMYSSTVPRSLNIHGAESNLRVDDGGPNRHSHRASPSIARHNSQTLSSSNHHNQQPSSPPNLHLGHPANAFNERDATIFRTVITSNFNASPSLPTTITSRNTLWWGELEPWMDEEYAKQVCTLMGWDPVNIKIPPPAPDPVTGQQPNNPGFCYLTFSNAEQAASILAQINSPSHPRVMPNSSKPLVLNWASSVPVSTPNAFPPNANSVNGSNQQFPKEYSIFVGDLAPEVSNSDLVAVFRNPLLGLRNDREPKFIRPFLSCKSAKIMLDPVTGVSRGYGFVRFTDEADQQRALIEMHGLYCLSRPMRISPATAKYKPPVTSAALDLPQVQFPTQTLGGPAQPVTIALPLPSSGISKSVSNPIATTTSNSSFNSGSNSVSSSGSGSSFGASNSSNSLGTGSATSVSTSGFSNMTPEEMINLPNNVLAQIAQQYARGDGGPLKAEGPNSITQQLVRDTPIRHTFGQGEGGAPQYIISEESWKHQARARAILGNLIGPNGEQLTSTDPYNTTVFVGGLSPLISEDTLRTFFAPFGEIHYVKVPVGKHCGFVQFVRKTDAERAIEKMQGFPIGGSRIRLSWGRSQYKAAQAAAQAAHAAAMQSQLSNPTPHSMTQEQAMQILQKLNMQGYLDYMPNAMANHGTGSPKNNAVSNLVSEHIFGERTPHPSSAPPAQEGAHLYDTFPSRPEFNRAHTTFSPFSPDPNHHGFGTEIRRHESLSQGSKAYQGTYLSAPSFDSKPASGSSSRTSPNSTRPSSASLYGMYNDEINALQTNRAPAGTISRPSSGSGTSEKPHDPLHDLNGSLANLDLDRSWKAVSEDPDVSSGPVPIRKERTPSPTQ